MSGIDCVCGRRGIAVHGPAFAGFVCTSNSDPEWVRLVGEVWKSYYASVGRIGTVCGRGCVARVDAGVDPVVLDNACADVCIHGRGRGFCSCFPGSIGKTIRDAGCSGSEAGQSDVQDYERMGCRRGLSSGDGTRGHNVVGIGGGDCTRTVGQSVDVGRGTCVSGGQGGVCEGISGFRLRDRSGYAHGGDDVAKDGEQVGSGCRVDGLESVVRGKRYHENRRRKERRKLKKLSGDVPEWRRKSVPVGFCETVVSQQSCPSYGQALSDAEREAKESLARRRAAENAVAEKLAKMKLESLEDEQKCQEYAELKRQRVIQWTNEATAKSQQSLEKCKSIDPSSSASQFEIRRQAKELADLKLEHSEFVRRVADVVPNCAELLDSCKMPGTATMEFYEAQAGFDSDVRSVDPAGLEDDLDRLIKFRKATSGRDLTKPRFQNLDYDPFAGEE